MIFYQNLKLKIKKQVDLLYLSKNKTLTMRLLKFRPSIVKNNKHIMPTMRSTLLK